MRKQPRGLVCGLARQMRRIPTSAEREVWGILRNRRCLGLKFRRQVVVDGMIVDFYCARPRIVLELDGAVHESTATKERDLARDRLLEARGIRVVRLRNEEANQSTIQSALRALLLRSPSPNGGEGDRG